MFISATFCPDGNCMYELPCSGGTKIVVIPLVAAVLGEKRQRLNVVLAHEYTPCRVSLIILLLVSIKYCVCALRNCGLVCSSVPVTRVTRLVSVGPVNPLFPRSSSTSTKHPESTIVISGYSVLVSWCVVSALCTTGVGIEVSSFMKTTLTC